MLMRWFRAFLPREERFFELFARHSQAVVQGALALQCREEDRSTFEILQTLNDADTALCVQTERAVVLALHGDCASPLGALAEVSGGKIHLTAVVAAAGGKLPGDNCQF